MQIRSEESRMSFPVPRNAFFVTCIYFHGARFFFTLETTLKKVVGKKWSTNIWLLKLVVYFKMRFYGKKFIKKFLDHSSISLIIPFKKKIIPFKKKTI